MPETIALTLYAIDELSQSARERARAWYREGGFDYDWYEFVFSDFRTICTILGVDIRTSPVRLTRKKTQDKPHIFFSGFWSQGDGACFEGSLCYAKQGARNIRKYAPSDGTLRRIADALEDVQRRNFYQLRASIRHQDRYYHEYCMAILVERHSPTCQSMTADAEVIVIEAMGDLARWLYRQLEAE